MRGSMSDDAFLDNSPIIESGVAILGPDDEWLTVNIRGLKFSIGTANDSKMAPITTEHRSRDHVLIRINVWQGGDLTFKFKVGTFSGNPLNLAVNLDVHYNHRIITYTFSEKRP
jgi:hypothetical protein